MSTALLVPLVKTLHYGKWHNMKFAEVLDSDMKMFAQLIHLLQSGRYQCSGKDLCASGDTIRWFQKVATDAASCYAESKTPAVNPSALPAEGLAIKSFHPGKASKTK